MRRAFLPRLAVLVLVSICLSGCAGPGTLPRLMEQRLGWMDEVAQVKQAKSLPVTDAKREAELLAAVEQQGTKAGLPAAVVRSFFVGQMEAAKVLQMEWLRDHAGQKAEAGSLPDLAKTVRPALDEIGKEMIKALARANVEPEKREAVVKQARERLVRAGFSQAVIEPEIAGLEAALRLRAFDRVGR